MEEDSPWGAPTSSSLTTRLDSPPLSSFGTTTTTTSWGGEGGGWGTSTDQEEEEYGSFGTTTVEARRDSNASESSSGSGFGRGLVTTPRKESIGDAWGAPDTQELPSTSIGNTHPDPSTILPPRLDSEPTVVRSETPIPFREEEEDDDDDDRRWTPSTPPLPPITKLDISSPSTSPTTTINRGNPSWEPSSFEEDDDSDFSKPPPLPSVNDLFSNDRNGGNLERRESVPDGEEAWGSAKGWEERQQVEYQHEQEEVEELAVTEEERLEIERKVREAEEAAERGEESWGSTTSTGGGKSIPARLVNGLKDDSREFARTEWNPSTNTFEPSTAVEPETFSSPPTLLSSLSQSVEPPTSEPPITNETPLPSLFRLTPTLFPNFKEGISKTAAKSNETLKGTTSSLRNARFGYGGKEEVVKGNGMSSIQPGGGGVKGHGGDEYDLDAPGRQAGGTKSSWWGRSGGGDAQAQKEKEDDNSNALGAHEVRGEGDSGKVEEPTTQQVGTIGRLFGRFKKTTTTNTNTEGGGGGSERSSAEQPRGGNKVEETSWKDEDFEALGSGRLGIQTQAQEQHEVEEMSTESRGFFGGDRASGRGSVKSRARVPTAPPEDDFGGLLGAFSTAPVQAQVVKPKTTKPYDPFDPLSEPPPTISPVSTTKKPVTSFPAPPNSSSRSEPVQSSRDDSFDAFFDSVTSSIPKPPLSSIPTPPLPSTASQRPPAILLPKPSSTTAKRTTLVSPIPRISSTSPSNSFHSPSSSTVPSRTSTPILPLAPPPPPSQPLSQRNNLLGGSLAPPPPPAGTISRPHSISPPPLPSGLLSTSSPSTTIPTKSASVKAPAPPSRGNSGPLSRDDLSFFENL